MALTDEQRRRYARNILLPEIGERGQQRLLDAKVLVVGAGGLGSAAAFYLAAAGVGAIGMADSDAVELSNLQRQILYRTRDLGRAKTESAAERLRDLNPDVRVIQHAQRLTADSILGVIEGHNFVVDATDNIASRYLISDACVLAGKGLAHAAVMGFEGQATTIVPRQGPCYRCLYPEPLGTVSSPQQPGILGAVAGMLGAVQAVETIKWIVGAGELLVGRLLVIDALGGGVREIPFSRNPACALCGEHPTVTRLTDQA